jgi:hypothetical protein
MPKHVLVVDDDRDHAESVAEARRVAAVDQGFGPLARWRERVGVRGAPATPPRGRSWTPPAPVEGLDARLGRITLPRMDIAGWLRGLGLGQYEPVFCDNDIDGAVLPSLTTEDLKDLGIISVGHRRRLLEAIAAPREGDEPTRPPALADAAPSRLVMAGDRGSRAGKAFGNAVLIAPATGELGIACR